MRPQRVLQVLGVGQHRAEVFKHALLDHLGIAALEIDQVRDIARKQHHRQLVGIAGRRQVDEFDVEIGALRPERLLNALQVLDVVGVGRGEVLGHHPDLDRLGHRRGGSTKAERQGRRCQQDHFSKHFVSSV
ncbi:hypothetical protein D3C72_1776910 [compost metagenome]